jgi:hypothetical protein
VDEGERRHASAPFVGSVGFVRASVVEIDCPEFNERKHRGGSVRNLSVATLNLLAALTESPGDRAGVLQRLS